MVPLVASYDIYETDGDGDTSYSKSVITRTMTMHLQMFCIESLTTIANVTILLYYYQIFYFKHVYCHTFNSFLFKFTFVNYQDCWNDRMKLEKSCRIK